MKNFILIYLLIVQSSGVLFGQIDEISIIPKPLYLEQVNGSFTINEFTTIKYDLNQFTDDNMKDIIMAMQLISQEFHDGFNGVINDQQRTDAIEPGYLSFIIDHNIGHDEAYTLSVTPIAVICTARTAKGWVYGWQTIKQLFPASFFALDKRTALPVQIPCLTISDQPRFSYRGMHLDVCRHFFSVDEVKKYIDLLAIHKMNRFHWHLTEDQGWRIEIKKYPRLTEIGGYRKETLVGRYSDKPHQFDGQQYGGFYTQEQIRDVVRYAAQRQVTIVPEIEMPGHSLAALASYPELACTEGPFEVATKWGVFEDVYCPTEFTFEFLENVLKEVVSLFPGEYIHIGGDECPKTRWKESEFCQALMKEEGLKDENELQSYFIHRIERILNKMGKKLIGWDEILEGGLSPGATVMSWRGISGGIQAAKMGHDVIMTPGSHCYFDHYQSDHVDEPFAIGGFTPLEKVYSYEPVPQELNDSEAVFVLGAQANVWTEYIQTFSHVEYMSYPRACALAEVLWSPKEGRDFSEFTDRLMLHQHRLANRQVNFADQLFDLGITFNSLPGKGVEAIVTKKISQGEIRYTLDGTSPNKKSKIYDEPVLVDQSTEFRASSFLNGEKVGRDVHGSVLWHKAITGNIKLLNAPGDKYSAGGERALINGINGSQKRYNDMEWLGFEGNDMEALIDLGGEVTFNKIRTAFFHEPAHWIYGPSSVSIFAGNQADHLVLVQSKEFNSMGRFGVIDYNTEFRKTKARYIKILAKNFGVIPEGAKGEGHRAWLFVDEIRLE